MKTKNKITSFVLTLSQSKWLQPAAVTLVVAVVLIGITGCKPHH
ncbi:MAG: hypothetical protein Q8N18_26075 [Opitutaceae bacterium]|nr:hypothetical protein [Opitutaceae bacterium]